MLNKTDMINRILLVVTTSIAVLLISNFSFRKFDKNKFDLTEIQDTIKPDSIDSLAIDSLSIEEGLYNYKLYKAVRMPHIMQIGSTEEEQQVANASAIKNLLQHTVNSNLVLF